MIEQKTVIERILIFANGEISVRLGKMIVDGDKVLANSPHLTSIPPGIDVDAQMAEVNKHLLAMGCAECADYQHLKDHARLAHTAEVVAAYRARLEDTA